ncbi:MAG: nucleotide exchange factor GrpE [Chitinophagales bacterium]|nr:nucleotide exchange factor GrpE [Chitinophagales bacterium]
MNTEDKNVEQEDINDEDLVQEETIEAQNEEENNNSESEVEQLKATLAEQKDKYLRLFADFDNFKKRTAKERLDLLNTAGKDIILSIIPILDDFDRAIAAAENATDAASVKEGMLLIRNKLNNTLEQRGLKAMDYVGQTFDPETQEAITEIPAPTEAMKGKVIDQVEKGYTIMIKSFVMQKW